MANNLFLTEVEDTLSHFQLQVDENFGEFLIPQINEVQLRSLEKATSTKALNLSCQSLKILPTEIGKITNLTSMNVSNNYLKQLPDFVFSLTHLTDLDLASNNFTSLEYSFSCFSALKNLNLRGNLLSSLSDFASQLPSLVKLIAENNKLTSISPISSSISTLTFLNLKNNLLSTLPEQLGRVRTLDLSNNQLTSLPQLNHLTSITELSLNENHLVELPPSFSLLTNLKRANLSYNKLRRLPKSLSFCQMVSLELQFNELEEICDDIGSFSSLERLNLSNNKLSSLPAEMVHLDKLETLNLSCNHLSTLPQSFTLLTSLKELYLGANHFSSFPSQVCLLPSLRLLHLAYNQLDGVDENIAKLDKLACLSLSWNRISHLREELFNLTKLRELHLAGNLLTSLPSSLLNLRFLEILDLSYNKLSGIEGNFQEKMIFLEKLAISHNRQLSCLPTLADNNILHVEMEGTMFLEDKKRFKWGCSEMKGRRWTFEDAVCVNENFRGKENEAFFAIFDGHGGRKAADYAAQNLPKLLEDLLNLEETKLKATLSSLPADQIQQEIERMDLTSILHQVFLDVNKKMGSNEIEQSGTTALVAYLRGKRLWIANAGDSRSVLCRGGAPWRISFDHKPYLHSEDMRIKQLGGFVSADGRINGKLAVARALGDVDIQPFVSPDPYINMTDLTSDDQFLILGCDGVWDVITDEVACQIGVKEKDMSRLSIRLRDYAYMLGSNDNISVLVISFPWVEI